MTADTIRLAALIICGVSLVALVAVLGGFAWRNRRVMKMTDEEIFDDLKHGGFPVVWRGDNNEPLS